MWSVKVGKAFIIVGIVAFVAGIGMLIFGITTDAVKEIGMGIRLMIGGLISYFCGGWEVKHAQKQNQSQEDREKLINDALARAKVKSSGGGKLAEEREREAWKKEIGVEPTEEQIEALKRGETIGYTKEQVRELQEKWTKELGGEQKGMEAARQRILTELNTKIAEAQRTGSQTIELAPETIKEWEEITGQEWPRRQ
jgi:molybdopterin converting factor small subunit